MIAEVPAKTRIRVLVRLSVINLIFTGPSGSDVLLGARQRSFLQISRISVKHELGIEPPVVYGITPNPGMRRPHVASLIQVASMEFAQHRALLARDEWASRMHLPNSEMLQPPITGECSHRCA